MWQTIITVDGYKLPKYGKVIPVLPVAIAVEGATSHDGIVSYSGDYTSVPLDSEDRASDILRTHYSTLCQSLKDPVNIARLLQKENILSEDAVTEVESAVIKNKTTVLLRSVRRAVNTNHQHLKVFGRVLGELAADNERIGHDILKDYGKWL